MAPSLRKRLTKSQQPSTSLASHASRDTPSPDTCENNQSKVPHTLNIPGPALTATPPSSQNTRRLHARASAHNVTPPQSLLNRYKRSAATTQVTTDASSPAQSTALHSKPTTSTAFTENFDRALSPTSVDTMGTPTTPDDDSSTSTRTYNGVEFEMVTQSPPQASETQTTDPKDTELMPRGLTIRKVRHSDGTPSPKHTAYLQENSNASPNQAKVKSEGEVEESPSDARGRTDATAELLSADRPSPLSIPVKKISSSNTTRSSKEETPSPIAVRPPLYCAGVSAGFQWRSPLLSSSRPSEPWGWMKAWTCCQCAHLDPSGRKQPAQTMVEQKTCSRLNCKHERCVDGCKIFQGGRFVHVPLT